MGLMFEPGFYTKIRIDDEGRIVDVDQLNEIDIPRHSHKIIDLDQVELSEKIADVLSNFFVNNNDNVVKFNYDRLTKTITADVETDDETLVKNEYGQLISVGSKPGNNNSNQVDETFIKNQLKLLQDNIPNLVLDTFTKTFVNNIESAVTFKYDKNTNTITADLRYDGTSISKNEHGDIFATGKAPGDGGHCASHTHIAEQIEDFEEAVKKLFDKYRQNIQFDLSQYIDNTTIKINKYGQLVAVRTALDKHTHTLSDIVDYQKPPAAATQAVSDLGTDVTYNDGVINFEKLNIGYSLLALSKYLKDVVNKNISKLDQQLNILATKTDNTGVTLLTVDSRSIQNNLYDLKSNLIRPVYYSSTVQLTLDFLPYSHGTIQLLHNDVVVSEAQCDQLNQLSTTVGRFLVTKVYQKGQFTARILTINVQDLLVGEDRQHFQVLFTVDGVKDYTNVVTFYSTPKKNLEYTIQDITDSHIILGRKFYNYPKNYKYLIQIKNYPSSRFINPVAGFDVYGKLTGQASNQTQEVKIPDLFTTSTKTVTFDYIEEHSDWPLLKDIVLLMDGAIVNNSLFLDGPEVSCKIRINNSSQYNSLQIDGELSDSCILELEKNGNSCDSQIKADRRTNTPGLIPINDTRRILTLGRLYDSGLKDMILKIRTKQSIKLDQLTFTPLNWF